MTEHIDSAIEPAADDGIQRAARFETHRPRLFGIAYRMLGTVDDANDVVQETYLRWHGADVNEIRAPEGWLVAVTTRLSIDRLRRTAVERERYPGDWLPEPLVTAPHGTDRSAELASDLSMAFLVLLERLAPEERAAFLAIRLEDRESLLAIVAPDATWTSDGDGVVRAARRKIVGGERIVRLVLGVERKWGSQLRHELAWINGEPAVITMAGDHLFATMSFDTDGEQLTGFYRVLNPVKLRHMRA